MTDLTLGLWIPTWNRAHFCNRLLQQIDAQRHLQVQAAIGLNPPSDGYVIPDWIRQIRNETNIGQSRNILQGIQIMETDYLWMIGDDEQIKPGALEEILSLIQMRPGMIICTDGVFNHGPSGYFATWIDWMDACVAQGREVMLTVQTLMTSTVFRRDGVDLALAEEQIATRYGHHFGMLAGLINEPVVVTRKPVFTAGSRTDSSIFSESDEYLQNHGPVTQQALRDLIVFVNELSGRNYPQSCYQPGVGFDS